MSSFTRELEVRITADGRCGVLLSAFEYHVGTEDSDDRVVVPAGFQTDFASSPFIVWPLIPPWGRYSKAATVHDFLYQRGTRTRGEADRIFLEAMCVLKVVTWQRYPMWLYVRIFGWLAWRRKRNVEEVTPDVC